MPSPRRDRPQRARRAGLAASTGGSRPTSATSTRRGPTAADEFWRSTPFAQRFDVDRELVDRRRRRGPAASSPPTLDAETASSASSTGEVVDVTVPTALAEQGVVVADLATAAAEHADLVERAPRVADHLDPDGTGADEDRTITVNDAAWTAGVFVHVPAEVELDAPIGRHRSTSPSRVPTCPGCWPCSATTPRPALPRAHLGRDVDALVDEVVEVIAHDAPGRRRLPAGVGDDVQHLSLQKVQAHRDATVRHLSVTIGGAHRAAASRDRPGRPGRRRPARSASTSPTRASGSTCSPTSATSPHATSDVLFKGALQGTAARCSAATSSCTRTRSAPTPTRTTEPDPHRGCARRRDPVPRDRVRRHHRRATARRPARSTPGTCSTSSPAASRATRRCG
jgi:Fe-S cluster assembly protein SufD